jgi:putative membrane protein
MKKIAVLSAAAVLLAAPAFAQDKLPRSPMPNTAGNAPNPSAQAQGQQGQKPAQQNQKVSAATRDFVQKAAITDMFEIEVGKLAQEKSQNDDYKEFGEMLVSDHEETSDKLKSIAGDIGGLQLPQALDAAHKQKLQKLQGLSGAQFDSQFKTEQVQGHQQAIRLFENYAKVGDHPELKQFAQQTLPDLREHLKQAQALPAGGRAPTVGGGANTR